jgi:hypothetical protein
MELVPNGKANLTNYAKSYVACAMYDRGKGFVYASMQSSVKDRFPIVALHLFGQGIEIIFKAMLLANDYEYYEPKIKIMFGHNLTKTADEVSKVSGLHVVRGAAYSELQTFSNIYKGQLLRYSTRADIYNFQTIPILRLVKRIHALIYYLESKKIFDQKKIEVKIGQLALSNTTLQNS